MINCLTSPEEKDLTFHSKKAYLIFCGFGLILLKKRSELNKSLIRTSLLQDSRENVLGKFCVYNPKFFFLASTDPSDSCPIGTIACNITIAPSIKTLCNVGDIGYPNHNISLKVLPYPWHTLQTFLRLCSGHLISFPI